MTGINRIALEAAHKINDIFVQTHHSEAQRTARIQIVVRDAIAAAQEKADERQRR